FFRTLDIRIGRGVDDQLRRYPLEKRLDGLLVADIGFGQIDRVDLARGTEDLLQLPAQLTLGPEYECAHGGSFSRTGNSSRQAATMRAGHGPAKPVIIPFPWNTRLGFGRVL